MDDNDPKEELDPDQEDYDSIIWPPFEDDQETSEEDYDPITRPSFEDEETMSESEFSSSTPSSGIMDCDDTKPKDIEERISDVYHGKTFKDGRDAFGGPEHGSDHSRTNQDHHVFSKNINKSGPSALAVDRNSSTEERRDIREAAWAAEVLLSIKRKESERSISCAMDERIDALDMREKQRTKNVVIDEPKGHGKDDQEHEDQSKNNTSEDHVGHSGTRDDQEEEEELGLIGKTQKMPRIRYQCRDCGKSYPTYEALEGHRSVHTAKGIIYMKDEDSD